MTARSPYPMSGPVTVAVMNQFLAEEEKLAAEHRRRAAVALEEYEAATRSAINADLRAAEGKSAIKVLRARLAGDQ